MLTTTKFPSPKIPSPRPLLRGWGVCFIQRRRGTARETRTGHPGSALVPTSRQVRLPPPSFCTGWLGSFFETLAIQVFHAILGISPAFCRFFQGLRPFVNTSWIFSGNFPVIPAIFHIGSWLAKFVPHFLVNIFLNITNFVAIGSVGQTFGTGFLLLKFFNFFWMFYSPASPLNCLCNRQPTNKPETSILLA